MGSFNNSRPIEVRLQVIEDVSHIPSDVEYDVDLRISPNGWTKCGDDDVISSIFRRWREDASRLHLAIRRDVELILRIDTKGTNATEDDIAKRSRFMDNIENIVGKGNGEEFLILDPDSRWNKLLKYLADNNIFPREKERRSNVYRTVDNDGRLASQRRSIDRAHNQVQNQNMKNAESFIDLGKLDESQLKLISYNNAMKRKICIRSVELLDIQDIVVERRLNAMKKDENFKRLISPEKHRDEHDESRQFDFVDIDDMFHDQYRGDD